MSTWFNPYSFHFSLSFPWWVPGWHCTDSRNRVKSSSSPWQNLIPLHGTWYSYMVLIIFFWAWKRVCFVWSASRLLIKSGRKLPTIMERSLCPIKVGQSRRSSHANERETVVVNSLSKMRSSTNSWPRNSVRFLLSLVRIGNMLLSWNKS